MAHPHITFNVECGWTGKPKGLHVSKHLCFEHASFTPRPAEPTDQLVIHRASVTHEYSIIHPITHSLTASVLFQEIPLILWNPNVHYRTHKSSSCIPILTHTNPNHVLCSYFLIIHFNIIFPSTPRYFKRSLSFKFPHQNSVCISPFHCIWHFLFLDLITQITFNEK